MSSPQPLFPILSSSTDVPDRVAVRIGDRQVTYTALLDAGRAIAGQIAPGMRLAVLVEREIETAIAVIGGLLAGATVIPVNPQAAGPELEYQLNDCQPDLLAHGPSTVVPGACASLPSLIIDAELTESTASGSLPPEPAADAPALIMYTSGTTGPPKGAVLSRGAVAANIDALAQAWRWTADDVLVHALPLYHVHGLVLGLIGPVRVGGRVHHTGWFDPASTAAALAGGGTMHFGVPTIYHRLADAAEHDPAVAGALREARLLVSGSAGLPPALHRRIELLCDQVIVERYGLTETMILTGVPAGTAGKAGTVGPSLAGVELRLVDDAGDEVPADGETMGEIWARTPSLFSGYLGREDATAAAIRDGWFVTGDMATRDADGYLRIVGRRSSDIIKSGGFKIGAGEIEDVLLQHPAVAEAAVKGLVHPDLGEVVAAWVVLRDGADLDALDGVDGANDVAAALIEHTADRLASHKRPRQLFVVDALPRNAMGKVQKAKLESVT